MSQRITGHLVLVFVLTAGLGGTARAARSVPPGVGPGVSPGVEPGVSPGVEPGVSPGVELRAPPRRLAKRTRRVRRSVTRGSRYDGTTHAISVSFVADAPLHAFPGSYGISVDYQLRITYGWKFQIGSELRFREASTAVQPNVGIEGLIVGTGQISVHAGAGLALPMDILPNGLAVAIAARGHLGLRWHMPWTRVLEPHLQLSAVVGPVVTPGLVAHDVHGSLQLIAGVRFNL